MRTSVAEHLESRRQGITVLNVIDARVAIANVVLVNDAIHSFN